MRNLIFLFCFSLCQLGLAGQVYDFKVGDTSCPSATLDVYPGDLLRWTNTLASGRNPLQYYTVRSALFNSGTISPGGHYDYTVVSNGIQNAPVTLTVYCGANSGKEVSTTINIHNAPIVIYPKYNLITADPSIGSSTVTPTSDPMDISILMLQNFAYDRLILSVDGTLVFDGDKNAYLAYTQKIGIVQNRVVLVNLACESQSYFPPLNTNCATDHEEYNKYTFHLPRNSFNIGSHVIEAQLTKNISSSVATYRDKAEFDVYMASSFYVH